VKPERLPPLRLSVFPCEAAYSQINSACNFTAILVYLFTQLIQSLLENGATRLQGFKGRNKFAVERYLLWFDSVPFSCFLKPLNGGCQTMKTNDCQRACSNKGRAELKLLITRR